MSSDAVAIAAELGGLRICAGCGEVIHPGSRLRPRPTKYHGPKCGQLANERSRYARLPPGKKSRANREKHRVVAARYRAKQRLKPKPPHQCATCIRLGVKTPNMVVHSGAGRPRSCDACRALPPHKRWG